MPLLQDFAIKYLLMVVRNGVNLQLEQPKTKLMSMCRCGQRGSIGLSSPGLIRADSLNCNLERCLAYPG